MNVSNDAHDLSANGNLHNGSTSKLYGANPPPAWSHRKSLFEMNVIFKGVESDVSFQMLDPNTKHPLLLPLN